MSKTRVDSSFPGVTRWRPPGVSEKERNWRTRTFVFVPFRLQEKRRPNTWCCSWLQDNGNSWSLYWDVETEPGEYSYPAIIPWNDAYKVRHPPWNGQRRLGCVCWGFLLIIQLPLRQGVGFCLSYTWKRRNIGFVSMSLAHLRRVGSTHKGV